MQRKTGLHGCCRLSAIKAAACRQMRWGMPAIKNVVSKAA